MLVEFQLLKAVPNIVKRSPYNIFLQCEFCTGLMHKEIICGRHRVCIVPKSDLFQIMAPWSSEIIQNSWIDYLLQLNWHSQNPLSEHCAPKEQSKFDLQLFMVVVVTFSKSYKFLWCLYSEYLTLFQSSALTESSESIFCRRWEDIKENLEND